MLAFNCQQPVKITQESGTKLKKKNDVFDVEVEFQALTLMRVAETEFRVF
jgi:hypothetical protein